MLQPTNAMITNATKLLPNGTYLLQWPGYVSLQVTVDRGASTGGTVKRKKKACACKVPSTSGHEVRRSPEFVAELKLVVAEWRARVTEYLKGFRRGVAPAERERLLSMLWSQTQKLLWMDGIDISLWKLTPELQAESDTWWAKQVDYLEGRSSPLIDTIAAMSRAAATKYASQVAKGVAGPQVTTAFLAVVLKLIQLEERLSSLHPSTRTVKAKSNPCNPPKKRVGPDAKCNANWDGIVSCVIRSGGLSTSDPAVAELVHAAGRRKDLPPKLIQKRGKPWGQIAHVLTEQGFTAPDQHGRPDEQATLETLVEALRGGPRMARMNLCQAERSLYQEV